MSDAKKVTYGILYNRTNHPISLNYGNEQIRVAPRQQLKKINGAILGPKPFPKGVMFIPEE